MASWLALEVSRGVAVLSYKREWPPGWKYCVGRGRRLRPNLAALLTAGSILALAALMSKAIPPVSRFMTPTPYTAERHTTLAKASTLMQHHSIRHLPVMDGDRLLGIITERDIKFAQSFDIVDPEKVSIYGAMAEDLYTVSPDTPIDEVVSTMAQKKLGSAVIVENKRVVGLLTTVDVCRAFAELLKRDVQEPAPQARI